MKKDEVKAYMQQAVDKIKSLGYDVYLYPNEHYTFFCGTPTYGYVVKQDGSRFSYFQLEEPWYCSVRFSTSHKACQECGTGFCCQDHWDAIRIENITKEHIEESFIDPPRWATPKQRKTALLNQWKDFEEFRTCKRYYGASDQLIKQ